MNRPQKQKPIERPQFEVAIAYLKSQIAIFSAGQNKSPRMEGYYRDELKEWEDE